MSRVVQLIRGGGLALVFTSVVIALALLTGLMATTPILVFPVAAIAGAVVGLVQGESKGDQMVGAALVGALAIGSGAWAGFGFHEICALIGSAAACLVVGLDLAWRRRVPISALALIALGLIVANLVPLVLDGGGLNHDESAYAVKAKHWLEETPETGWNLHRGIAMSGYGYLVLQSGGAEAQLRLLGLAAIIGLAVATWVLGHRIGGKWVGALSAIALLSSPVLLRRSTEYLSDVPSSALLVACMIVIWGEFGRRERPTYRLLWALPFAWAAFYIRYQSALSFALMGLAVVVLFWDKVRAGWRPLAVTAVLGVAGLVPHFVFAVSTTGSPLGILLFTARISGRQYYGEGLVDYFLLMGWPLAAFIGPLAVLFFVWWLVAARHDRLERVKCLFLLIPAAGQVLILGVLSHGEARFIFFPLALTLIGGVTGVLVVTRAWRPATARAVTVGLSVLLVGSLAMSASYVRRAVEGRIAGTETIELAASEVRELSGDDTCGVMTSYLPQITFYSECYTTMFRTQLEPEDALELLSGNERYLLMIEDGKRQPAGDDLSGLLELTTGDPVTVESQHDSAEIFEFGP